MQMKVGIIGSGIGALASAIELRKLGLEVHVFEANEVIGGKIVEQHLADYRFDMGPSVFTEPALLQDLIKGLDPSATFAFRQLTESCRYFFKDGQNIVVPVGKEKVAQCSPITSNVKDVAGKFGGAVSRQSKMIQKKQQWENKWVLNKSHDSSDDKPESKARWEVCNGAYKKKIVLENNQKSSE